MGLVVFKWGIFMMDMVWIQKVCPLTNAASISKIWLGLIPLGNHYWFYAVVVNCFNYQFLNQKLQTVGLTKSQGLGMQKQIQGTDELQMWTGFTGFNRLSRVCQVTGVFLLYFCWGGGGGRGGGVGGMCTHICFFVVFICFKYFWHQSEQLEFIQAVIACNN